MIAGIRPGQLIFSHLFYSQERENLLNDAGVRCLFIIRDLRDIVVSESNYLSTNSGHIYHGAFSGAGSQRERILRSLEGCAALGLPSMAQLFDGFRGWLRSCAHVVRFEDLIGHKGGGDDDRQRQALSSLFDFLGISCDSKLREQLASCVYSEVSPTFNRGGAIQWPHYFDAEIKRRFKEMTGNAIVVYGYETSTSW
jgi:hypothetical protein